MLLASLSRSMALVGTATTLLTVSAQADRVGIAGAVNTRSVSTQPGDSERVIEIGKQIVRNERIETSASGSVQVLFIDKTALTIGPNSKLTIDEFVFNPVDGTGTMAVRLSKGLMRVVGGQVTHTGGATITTPTATIGVRGGIATIGHCTGACDTPGTRAILHFGSLAVSPLAGDGSAGAPQIITRPGFGTIVASVGATPTPPARVASAEIADANASLTSKPTQKGGSTVAPSDQGAARGGIGASVASDPATTTSRQAQNANTTSASTATLNRTPQVAQLAAQQGQQSAISQATAQSVSLTTSVSQPSTPVTAAAGSTLVGYAGGVLRRSSAVPTAASENTASATASYIVSGRAIVVGPSGSNNGGAKIEAVTGIGSGSPKVVMLNFGSAPIIDTSRAYPANGTVDLSKLTSVANPNADPARSAYADSRKFGSLSEVTVDPATGARRETSGFYNDVSRFSNVAGTTPVTPFNSIQSFFVSSDAVGANTRRFLSSLSSATVTPCDCEYTRWGFWSAQATGTDPLTNRAFAIASPLNTWVAGVAARLPDMPTTGQATYVGHAIATISNGPNNTYLSSGAFSNTVNFGTSSGFVTISNLDRTNYSGAVAILPGTTQFAGSLGGSIGGRSASLQGMFYQGGPTNLRPGVGEMGGSVNISGANAYMGSGTFAAKLVSGSGLR